MALWFPLKLNDTRIGSFYAHRRESEIPADRWCTYDVTVVEGDDTRRAVVRHHYDAGAFALVRAALAAVVTEGVPK